METAHVVPISSSAGADAKDVTPLTPVAEGDYMEIDHVTTIGSSFGADIYNEPDWEKDPVMDELTKLMEWKPSVLTTPPTDYYEWNVIPEFYWLDGDPDVAKSENSVQCPAGRGIRDDIVHDSPKTDETDPYSKIFPTKPAIPPFPTVTTTDAWFRELSRRSRLAGGSIDGSLSDGTVTF